MKMTQLTLFLIFGLSFSSAAFSGPLEDIIRSTWNSDPFLHSQTSRIKAAELDRFARFLPNNPNVTYIDADNSSWRTYSATLQMGLPGKAFAYRKVDNELLKAEETEMTAKKIELASFVVDRYTSCASSKELVAILKEAVDEMNTLRETITVRYEMGQSTQAERIGIELQHRQALIEFNSFSDQYKVACAKFAEFLDDRKIDKAIIETVALTDDIDSSVLSELGTRSIDIIRAENDMKVADAQYDVAFWRAMPDLTLGYYRNNYNRVVASPIVPVKWTNSYSVTINIPILFPFYERSEILKEKASQMIASRRAWMKKLESERTLEESARSFVRNKTILKKLQAHDLPMAETMLDSTFAAYKQGKLGFSELILAKRTWLDLKKEEVNLKYNLLNARLVCLNGCERN